MTGYQINRLLGILYIIGGGVLFFMVAGEFLFRASIALIALYLISYGFKLQGYPFTRFIFKAQQWRSRF